MLQTKLSLALVLAIAPTFAVATNGSFLPGFGVKALGAGGVGIALQADSLAQAANPANLTSLGMRGDLGLTFLNPERSSAVGDATGLPRDPNGLAGGYNFGNGPQLLTGKSQSGNDLYLLPDMALAFPVSEKVSIGFAVTGVGGGNTTYKENIFGLGGGADGIIKSGGGVHGGRRDLLSIDLIQLMAPVSVAYKVTPEHTLGVSLNLAAQRFKANGLGQFNLFGISSDPQHLTNQGYDYSYGAGVRLGWLGKFANDRMVVGATWASKTYMTKFDQYRGLFPEQGDLDIPENYGLGIAVKPVDNVTMALDVVRIMYKGVKSFRNFAPGTGGFSQGEILENGPSAIAVAGGPSGPGTSAHPNALGQDEGMGFGWKNMTVYKLGLIYDATNRLTLRAGYNYGKMPIRLDQPVFSALVPATSEHHYSVGFTYQMKGSLDWEISGAYMYVANNEVNANQQPVLDQVSYEMRQHVLGLGFGVKY